jgi:hypothetical protein
MRKMYEGNGAIRHWSKEIVYSVHRYYTLKIECATFYWADGTTTKSYEGTISKDKDFRLVTQTYKTLNDLVKDFEKLLGW